jgi:hypothetical protein
MDETAPEVLDEKAQKRKCCQDSFLASVVGLRPKEHQQAGPVRRAIGVVVLAGFHLFLLFWSAVTAVFQPHYRRVLAFQVRYLRDVLARELREGAPRAS